MRIIAVDDEALALKDLLNTLEKALPKADMEGFTGGREAIESAARVPVDVAFLDIEMGGMSGIELARRLKDIRGETNVVFVTGYSHYAVDAFRIYASGYLLKPATEEEVAAAMEHLRNPVVFRKQKKLRVQTFGNFEVFADGVPLRFPRSKSKELFAYLIHKRGTGCTTREIAAVLYGDRPYTFSLQKQVQTVLSAMVRTLKKAGFADCILRGYNKTAVSPANIDCDFYRFLNGDADAVNEYLGEYMTNYSWAEFVVGYLDRRVP